MWVEYGVSVRNATLAESIAMRNLQAQQRQPLANAELPNTHYDGPTRYDLIKQANEFVAQAV